MDTAKEIDTDLPHGVGVVLHQEAGQEHYNVDLRVENPGTLRMHWATARRLASRLSDAAAMAESYNSDEFVNGCLVEYLEWAIAELRGPTDQELAPTVE